MPKCYLLKEQESRSKELCRQIYILCKRKKINQAMIGDCLGYTQGRVCQKFREGNLNIEELLKLLKLLSADLQISAEGRIKLETRDENGTYSNVVVDSGVNRRDRMHHICV